MRGALLFICASALQSAQAKKPGLWLWLTSPAELPQVVAHKDIITDISFAGFSCASNGSLASHLNTSLLGELKAAGVKTHPLVGCSMPTLRTLFASPDAFISAAVEQATAHGFDGFNLDFEPYGAAQTNADGADYAKFLDMFAKALHADGKILSVDYFSNLPIWNLPAMNDSATDMFISMDTYVQGNETFEAYRQVAYSYLEPARVGLGMATAPCAPTKGKAFAPHPYGPDPCGDLTWTQSMLTERFEYLTTLLAKPETEFKSINLWVLPVPDLWWTNLAAYYEKWGAM